MTTRKPTGRSHDLEHFNYNMDAYLKYQAMREVVYVIDCWECQVWVCGFCGRVFDFERGRVPKNYICSCGLKLRLWGNKCRKMEIEQWNETKSGNGRGRTFDCHHLNRMTDDNRKKNLLTTCSSCHRKLHPKRRWRRFAGKEE